MPISRVILKVFLALLLLGIPVSNPVAGESDLTTTSQRHFRQGAPDSPIQFPVRRVQQLRVREYPSSVLLHDESERRLSDMRRERQMSDSCKAGDLRQHRDRQFIVRFDGYVYGAGIGGHWSLVDLRELASPGQIYAFRRHGTGRCEVYKVRR